MDKATADWMAAMFPDCSVSPLGGIGELPSRANRAAVVSTPMTLIASERTATVLSSNSLPHSISSVVVTE